VNREPKSNKNQKGTETIYRNSNFTGNTMALTSDLSILTLNANGLNSPIKRHGIRKDKNTRPINMLLTRHSF